MAKYKILLLALILPLLAFNVHKYYLSLHKVEYKEADKTVQISMRIFIDDLQETINTTYGKNLELAVPNEPKEVNTLIESYISQHFAIKINSLEKKHTFLGKEYDNDVVLIYLEVADIPKINSVEIKNNMLMEKFPEQQHIVKLLLYGKKKTFILTSKNDKDLLKL